MTVFHSPYPDVEIPDIALTPEVFRHVDRLADRVAVVDGPTGRSYTYAELFGAVRKTAGGLVAAGLAKGDVVAILAPNLPEYGIIFHAVATAGGTVTTINPTYTVDEIVFQLTASRARILFTIPHFLESAMPAASSTSVDLVYVLGEGGEGHRSFFELLAADPIDQVDVDPESHVVVLPYSSGTTGLPKGVELTHRNLVANLAQYAPVTTTDQSDVVLAVLPFFHIYGMQVLMNGVLHNGARTVTMPRFDLEEFLRTIQEHKVTRIAVVPPIVVALAKSPLVDQYDLSSLVQIGSGAAPLSAEVEEEATRRTGAPVVQGFGLTETSPVTHAMPAGETRTGSIGVPVPNTEVRVVDPQSGDDLDVGGEGELWIRGPQVMKGYLDDPGATEACLDEEGWLHTGDIGRVDEEGYWYITDRLKELIKYKGFQVAPAELEAVLLTHPAVSDAAVVGVEDEEAGEVPKAFVVLQPGADPAPGEIMEYVANMVAGYKQVRHLEYVDQIPKSLSGKILRRVLRDREAMNRV
ncbi:MAG TPA: 4-coumarate--CoA ligase family protein [Acidimicrobiia bacterium]|nr:4-coumarate--CoA ligase family protein [Acidimicrobiia bacterium]